MSRLARLATICLLAGVVLFWGLATFPVTPDGFLHLQRVRALSEALAAGVIYPRWFPDFSFGYGYPVLNYYAPGFYYGPALLTLAGLDVATATQLALAVWFGLSAAGMYALLRLWVPAGPALVGVVLFLAFPYRLYDLYVRGALPEFAAFLWLPWIAYFTAREIEPRTKEAEFPRRLLPAALCWAGLILTHNLTALMAGMAAVVLLPVLAGFGDGTGLRGYGRRLVRVGAVLLGPLALGALVSAWYWAPALLEASSVGIGAGAESQGYAHHFATWSDLFTWGPVFPYPDAAAPTVPLPGWMLLVVGMAAVGLWRQWGATRFPAGALAGGLAVTVVALWLTTAGSAWLWRVLEPLLGKLQFPWRWQAVIGASLPLLLAVGWLAAGRMAIGWWEAQEGWRRQFGAIGYTIVSVLLVAYATLGLPVPAAGGVEADITTTSMWAADRERGQVGASWTAEFLPLTVTEQRWAIGRAPSDGSTAAARRRVPMRAVPQRMGYLSASYEVEFEQPGSLILHQFSFPAWRVTVDGAPAAARAEGDLGLLAVDLPAGEHTVVVVWGVTTAVWFGRMLTAAGWAIVLWLLAGRAARGRAGAHVGVRTGREDRPRASGDVRSGQSFHPSSPQEACGGFAASNVAAWMAVGLVLLLGASGVTAREVQPAAVGADFGAVRLEAADAPPARAGEQAAVRLHWSIQGPVEPLTAFVHVVDAAGTVVAQHDGPLGGDYTPPERWLPGMVLAHTHFVPLPAELPPGRYTLKAGVYRPGAADAPLVTADAEDARVDVGVLEVRP